MLMTAGRLAPLFLGIAFALVTGCTDGRAYPIVLKSSAVGGRGGSSDQAVTSANSEAEDGGGIGASSDGSDAGDTRVSNTGTTGGTGGASGAGGNTSGAGGAGILRVAPGCDRWDTRATEDEAHLLDLLNGAIGEGSFCLSGPLTMNPTVRCAARFVVQQLQLDFTAGRAAPSFPQVGWTIYSDTQALWTTKGSATAEDARAALLESTSGLRTFCGTVRRAAYKTAGIGRRENTWAVIFAAD